MKHFAAVGVLVALLCAPRANAAVARSGQVVMGTVLTVTVVARERATAQRLAEAAIDEARRWDDALTIWRPEGELAEFNAKAGQGAIPISARLERGLAAMLEFANLTGGAFEPAVATLPMAGNPRVRLRGIGRVLIVHPADAKMHTASAVLEKASALDPGAIGKGLALDAIQSLLQAGGARAAFLDFGGSSQTALGPSPGDPSGWAVVIAGLAAGSSHGSLKLKDASLSTSRAGALDTKPILDPRSGMPVSAPLLVTTRASSATAADAWSTALVVLGRDGIPAASASGLDVLIEDPNGTSSTPGLDLEP